jgi:hypothetical protein
MTRSHLKTTGISCPASGLTSSGHGPSEAFAEKDGEQNLRGCGGQVNRWRLSSPMPFGARKQI